MGNRYREREEFRSGFEDCAICICVNGNVKCNDEECPLTGNVPPTTTTTTTQAPQYDRASLLGPRGEVGDAGNPGNPGTPGTPGTPGKVFKFNQHRKINFSSLYQFSGSPGIPGNPGPPGPVPDMTYYTNQLTEQYGGSEKGVCSLLWWQLFLHN